LAGNMLLFLLSLILLPPVARSQTNSLMNDPVFRAARKAQQEGRIADAETILNDRIHAIEQTQPNSTELVPYLNMLAGFYSMKQQFPDALAIFERVLKIDRAAYGPSDSRSLRDLINVASFLGPEKKDQVEQLLKQALDLALQNPNSPPGTLAEIYAHLAMFYQAEQRWYDAEPLAAEGMKICVSVSLPPGLGGPCEPLQRTLAEVYRNEGRTVEGEKVAASGMEKDLPPELNALDESAQKSEKDGLFADAEYTYRQAAAYIEAHPKWDGGKMPADLRGMASMEYNNLGRVLEKEGRNDLAEEAYKKAIASREATASEIPIGLRSFNFSGLMSLYQKEGRLSEMEPIFQHALELQEKAIGESSIDVARTLVTFGNLYKSEGKYANAEPLFERAMKIYETNLGHFDRQEVFALESYADILLKLHEEAKAAELQARIKEIEKKQAELLLTR
jgi:tetratricopeptide (TPR) repeat protein